MCVKRFAKTQKKFRLYIFILPHSKQEMLKINPLVRLVIYLAQRSLRAIGTDGPPDPSQLSFRFMFCGHVRSKSIQPFISEPKGRILNIVCFISLNSFNPDH